MRDFDYPRPNPLAQRYRDYQKRSFPDRRFWHREKRQHKRYERQKDRLEAEREDVPDSERIDGCPLMGFAAQGNQDCCEASETDGDLCKSQ